MTVEQLEKFLHFFGKDNYVVLVLKANIDNIGDFTYKYLTTKYRDVIVKLIVSKNKGVYRPTEFPRENQKDNAFAIKVKDWNEKIIPTEVLFKHTIEDRINKKVKKTDYLRKSEKNTSLENVKDIIEKYLLSEASTEYMVQASIEERTKNYNILIDLLRQFGWWDRVEILRGNYEENFNTVKSYIKSKTDGIW